MRIEIIIFIIIALLLLLKVTVSIKEQYTNYLNYRSKCYSCETDLINRYGLEYAYLGQPTKGFSEEQELILRTGRIDSALAAHPISI
jgi:hypothetical protein